MNRLPYELQFKILSDLSDQEVFAYCQTNRNAWRIWSTASFWEGRARENFGLRLDHAGGSSPHQQYRELARLEEDEPALLLILAITENSIEHIPKYFQKADLLYVENGIVQYKPLLSIIMAQLAEDQSKQLFLCLQNLIDSFCVRTHKHIIGNILCRH